jgi:DNA polymerase III delta prime subunit
MTAAKHKAPWTLKAWVKDYRGMNTYDLENPHPGTGKHRAHANDD